MTDTEKLSTITGTAVVVAYLSPADPAAATETVVVRGIARADWNRARLLLNNDDGLIALVTGKPPGWTATITDDSFVELLAAVQREAASFFAFSALRAQRDLAMQPPEVLEKILTMARESMSPKPLPTSPSPAG